ncbi:SGNH/GDSL hydrolase family protein [Bradyrhizobium sp. 186]|uniref:SGNH/GDSL hydrolase family protein n=1 Tax=Bradyrhizobium sp. 186 TaxID=2782654 RepID=UPI0020018F56|nr:SGNH/GDSL hydrolase family protein [Bradyrhizobium sp. 186]UPK31815.1 SGNH/GDSL hydrolase family protein [Bradyrhizobium sp. 186]
MMFSMGAQRVRAAGGGSEIPPPAPTPGVYLANDPAISYSDCSAPSFVNGWARFVRPMDDSGGGLGPNYRYCMPGARQRFRSNAPLVQVQLRWNGLVTRADARNLIGHVFVNGAFVQDFQTPAPINTVTTATVPINMGSSADRLYEIILPYGDGVEFGLVQVDPAYTVTAAAPRTGRVMVNLGDSITQGFWSTDTRRAWWFLLAQSKGFRTINMGSGGRLTVSDDGTAAANLAPDLITVLLGTNDYLNQIPVATYKANLKQLLININAISPSVPVYISAPIPTTQTRPIPFSDYAVVAGQCIAELGYSQLHGVNNGTLITDTATQLLDGVHPNDAGSVQTAAGWGAAIV